MVGTRKKSDKRKMQNIRNKINMFVDRHKALISAVYYVLIIALVLFTFSRCFDNVLWGDEAFTARLSRVSVPDLIQMTASDVHPPLYYLLVKLFVTIFGESGFVYHLVSFLPYLILMIISCTILRKRYGKLSSLLFSFMITLMPIFATYNVEIRMYSLASLFIFLTFLTAISCFRKGSFWQYILLAIFATLSAYTHYYCIVMCVIVFVVLLVANIIRKKDIIKTIVAGILVLIMYTPWLTVLLSSFGRVSGDWHSSFIPGVKDVISYPFASSIILGLILFACIFVSLLYSSGALIRKGFLNYEFNLKKINLNEEFFKSILGVAVYFGTMAVGIVVSKMFRPLFLMRYIVPAVALLYYILAISLNKFEHRRIKGIVLFLLIGIFAAFPTAKIYFVDKVNVQKTEYAVQILDENLSSDTVVLTDHIMLDWTVIEYYFSGVKHRIMNEEELKGLENNGQKYVVMWNTDMSSDTKKALEDSGFEIEKIITKQDGSLGMVSFSGYVLNSAEER